MKKSIFLIILILAIAIFSNISGQQVQPPSVADNATPQDNTIKMRSVELERIKREAVQAEAAKFAPINTKIEAKFPEIKEDFEGIQISQTAIVTAYTKGEKIDYGLIETSANDINKKAKRLDSNLFAEAKNRNKDESKNKKEEETKDFKDLIVELDNTIGSFVSSPIFGNLKVIEPETAIKTRTDLLNIQELSEKLSKEAAKLK